MQANLINSLDMACKWFAGPGVVRNEQDVSAENRQRHAHTVWTGAVRGEYRLALQKWGFFCPVWHTGQALKALVAADAHLDTDQLATARLMADFLLKNQVESGTDQGLLLAYEDFPGLVNTSAQLEALGGLFALAETTGDRKYAEQALKTVEWVAARAYRPGKGLFRDLYDPMQQQFTVAQHWSRQGRPLLDDGIFIIAYKLTGNARFLDIALETADHLLEMEQPAGNWGLIQPCLPYHGFIHPRHAYWWGYPMLSLYDATGDTRYLTCFKRSVQWYKNALRRDGGLFRHTGTDFQTPTFGACTSGSACAAIMLIDAYDRFKDLSVLPFIHSALGFCMQMQFTAPTVDESIRGAIIESVTMPDGSDNNPYYVRDTAVIFTIQAIARALAAQIPL